MKMFLKGHNNNQYHTADLSSSKKEWGGGEDLIISLRRLSTCFLSLISIYANEFLIVSVITVCGVGDFSRRHVGFLKTTPNDFLPTIFDCNNYYYLHGCCFYFYIL